ncbi:hypothetical protein [Flavobacterium coralii]|uniref:hypothetical protein n=1 Tax=Flavobacterium coralii TaxID=2838017 RepID=UPI000C4CDDB1|nr:hypothetical protein [Flavobacterium sp.]|tara:strand:- start:13068 stop:15956 length:2889 start_codon:yes stop_codon:yes gene_type:complete
MSEKIELAKLELNVEALLQATANVKDNILFLREQQALLRKEGQETSLQYIKNAAEIKNLSKEYNSLEKAVASQISVTGQMITKEQALENAVKSQNVTIQNAIDNNRELRAIKRNVDVTTEEGRKTLERLNKKIDENTTFIKENGDAYERQKMEIGNYKDNIVDAANELNVFNGGFGGFIQRAEAAGGVLPLVTKSLGGVVQGIKGMTTASLRFLATPIGAVIGAIGLVLAPLITYLTQTQEGIDKVTSFTRPLQAIFQSLVGVLQKVGKWLFDTFNNPKQAIQDFGRLLKENIENRLKGFMELIPKLGEAFALLFEGEFRAAAKTATDAMGKVAFGTENITDKVVAAMEATGEFLDEAYTKGQLIDKLQKELDRGQAIYTIQTGNLKEQFKQLNLIAEDTNNTFAEREKAAKESINTAREMNRLTVERLDKEIEIMKIKQSLNDTSNEERQALAELIAKRNEANAQMLEMETTQNNKLNAIRKEAAAKAKAERQKALDDYAAKLQLELDLFVEMQEGKSKSLQGELTEAERVKNDKLKIAEAEYKASERTANDRLELEIKKQSAIREYVEATSEITKSFATAELDLFIQQNQSKLENARFLTDELYKEEEKRLASVKERQLQQLALEKNTNAQVIEQKQANNEALTLNDLEYLTGKAAIEQEYNVAIDNNNIAFREFVKKRDADQALIDKELKLAEAKSEYERQLIEEDFRHQQEMIRLKEQLNDRKITQQQFDIFQRAEAEKTAAIQTQLALQKQEAELGAYSTIAGAISEMFGQNKALALAMAGIDGAKAITSILAQYPKFDGGIAMWAAIAAAGVTTAMQVRKISSTKPPKEPKFEKGGGLKILGGSRHAQGGVKFSGSDGTRFEAEQGEIIGVMNRNAASHFLAFNSLFNSGASTVSRPSYFANGGAMSVSSGQNIDVRELAIELAEANRNLPPPVVKVQDIISETTKTVTVQSQSNF